MRAWLLAACHPFRRRENGRGARRGDGSHARAHVLRHFSVDRLLKDIESLDEELLARPRFTSRQTAS